MNAMSQSKTVDVYDAYAMTLEEVDVRSVKLMRSRKHLKHLARLCDGAPVHGCKDRMSGPYWSITQFADIRLMDVVGRPARAQASFVRGKASLSLIVHRW